MMTPIPSPQQQTTPNGGNGDAAHIATEWRQNVNEQLGENARLLREAAATFAEVKTQLIDHNRRINNLENVPATTRGFVGTYGGCIGQVVYAALTSFALLISITSVILSIVLR